MHMYFHVHCTSLEEFGTWTNKRWNFGEVGTCANGVGTCANGDGTLGHCPLFRALEDA